MAKLVLVDGSSYLYRAFHALPDLRTSKGEPTGALRGVLSMLRRLVIDDKPDYFAVVFDAPGKTFRDGWYAEYKANRAAMPDDLALQIAPLHELVRAHGWPLLMVDGVEADDVIGTLARAASEAGIATLISTSDKDLAQLVRPGVTLMNTMTNERLDHDGVVAKFGVRPDQVLDLLTLTGDAVDNIPGVPKVGPKTAAKWLAQYGSLDEVVAHAAAIPGVVGQNLRDTLAWLPEGKRLLTVRCDCDLPSMPTDLRVVAPEADRLRALYERFEFKMWLQDIARGDRDPSLAGAAGAASAGTVPVTDPVASPPVPPPRVEYETVLDEAALSRWLHKIGRAELVSVDTSTSTSDPLTAEIVGISLALEPATGCYIPFGHRYAGAPTQLGTSQVLDALTPWLADPLRPKLGQNLKYAQHALANHGIDLRGCAHDTEIESYVIESHKPHDLEGLARRHLDLPTIGYDAVTGKGVHRIPFDQVALDRATEYAAENADVALRVHRTMMPQIDADPKLQRIYAAIEMPVRDVLFKMERAGVLIDSDILAAQSRDLGARVSALEQEAHQLAGTPFNLGSPKQLCEILFDRMQLPIRRKTPTGQPSTDEDVLQELAASYPLPNVLLEWRALAKLKSTYTDKLPAMVNARTGRLHTTFSQTTAVTGRLASTEPNLQNIPVRTADGRRIREAFVAPPAHTLISADYSQVELRIMAHLSEDPALVKAFEEGDDIHRVTAADVFDVPKADVTADQRRTIKAVNFGLIYGMSAFGLAAQLGIERRAAAEFIERYFARYPGVAVYMARTRELARAQGYVETVFGRRLFLPDIRAASGPRRAGSERAAINAPMQGTAADLVKLAMIAVQDYLERERLATRLILQVHDELVLESPDAEVARIERDLPDLMTSVAELRVPLKVDVGRGPNWERAH
ncbi:MAG: DNA polymerase I [Betaproteobacteria bacterium]